MPKDLNELTRDVVVNDQIVHIRPISGADVETEKRFIENLSPQSRYFRFLGGVSSLPDAEVKEFCSIDFDKKMAFIALIKDPSGNEQEVGIARYASDEFDHLESAVTVSDDWQNHGLGQILMRILIDFARHKGKELIYSVDPIENTRMRALAMELGMNVQREPDDANMIRYELKL